MVRLWILALTAVNYIQETSIPVADYTDHEQVLKGSRRNQELNSTRLCEIPYFSGSSDTAEDTETEERYSDF